MKDIINLEDLKGMKVTNEVDGVNVPCEIVYAHVDTYYFHEKSEQMNVFVSLRPLDYETNTDYDLEDFKDVAISYVRKLN